MLDVLIHQYIHNFSKLYLTSFKFAAIKWFFKSLEESAKCHQRILCEQTDESKCLVYRHILKTVVKVVEVLYPGSRAIQMFYI